MINKTVSYYNNADDSKSKRFYNLDYVLGMIRDDQELFQQTVRLRSMPTEEEYKQAKKLLPMIAPSGVFDYRNDDPENLREYSNVLVLDLLVSKDAATLPLLEVGASIRQRYQEQAQKCPLQFLYRAMKLCNDCDLNYRASKNKRLLVELTLIQVAQLTTEGDDVSGGRGPKQTIKPVFTQPAAAQQPQVASAPSAQQTTVHSAPSPVAAPSVSNTAVRQPQTSATAGSATPVNTTSVPSQGAGISSTAREERKIPVMKMSSLGVSIKNPQRDQAAQNAAKTNVAQTQTQQPEEDFIFNDRDLNYYWQEYAGQLPKEQVAIAKRMQVIRPVLLNNSTTFEVVVDNEIAAKDFTALIPELQTYLRGRLKNSKVAMTVRVSEPAETVRAVGRVEKFQMMAQKNQALMQLKDEFGLELY